MAQYQGLKKLQRGDRRKLTPSEAKKGYFFITNDKAAHKILGEKFDCEIDGVKLTERKIDKSGRITIGRKVSRKLMGKSVSVKLVGKKIMIAPV